MTSSSPPTGTVTFLLTDIEGSTQMWERNPGVMKEALGWHDRVVREAIERNGGYVFSTAGDSFAAAFGDPMQGAAAAIQIQEEIGSRDWEELGELKVRMGLDAGIAEERDGDYFGPPVNRAARIMSLARGGELLTSHTAADLLRHHLEEGIRLEHLGKRELKGMTTPEIVFAVEYGPQKAAPGRKASPSLLWVSGAGIAAVIAVVAVVLATSGGDGEPASASTAAPTSGVQTPTQVPDSAPAEQPPTGSPALGPEALTSWRVRPLNDGGEDGAHPALAVGDGGEKLVAFQSPTAGDLRAVICRDQTCRRVARVRIDAGMAPSAAIGADGLAVMSYHDPESRALKLAHCDDPTCSDVTVTTVDGGPVGSGGAVAVGRDGSPIIAYFDEVGASLKVAHCGTADCTTVTSFIVDDGDVVGMGTAIAVGDDGLPVISYLDSANDTLKVAHCDQVNCSAATITAVDMQGDPGIHTAMVVADGVPHIVYRTIDAVLLVRCRDAFCSRADTTMIDEIVGGTGAAVGFGAGGAALIAYHSSADGLRLARCGDGACSTVTVYAVDTTVSAGIEASMAVLPSGLPLIAYSDESGPLIRLAIPEAVGG